MAVGEGVRLSLALVCGMSRPQFHRPLLPCIWLPPTTCMPLSPVVFLPSPSLRDPAMPWHALPPVATSPTPDHPPPPPPPLATFLAPAITCPTLLSLIPPWFALPSFLSLPSFSRPKRPCACSRCRRPCCVGKSAEIGVLARCEAGVSPVDGVGEAELRDGRGAEKHGAGVPGKQGD